MRRQKNFEITEHSIRSRVLIITINALMHTSPRPFQCIKHPVKASRRRGKDFVSGYDGRIQAFADDSYTKKPSCNILGYEGNAKVPEIYPFFHHHHAGVKTASAVHAPVLRIEIGPEGTGLRGCVPALAIGPGVDVATRGAGREEVRVTVDICLKDKCGGEESEVTQCGGNCYWVGGVVVTDPVAIMYSELQGN